MSNLTKIYNSISEIKKKLRCVIAIGVFDGVHLGHLTLINKVKFLAKKMKVRSVIYTFLNHPDISIHKKKIEILSTVSEKIKLLSTDIVIIDKDTFIFRLKWQRFIKLLLEKLDIRYFVCGNDFRFGKNQGGNPAVLKKLGEKLEFKLVQIPQKKNCESICLQLPDKKINQKWQY